MRTMPVIARTLWDALTGGLLAFALVRLLIALDAASVPDLLTGQTEQAGFLPQVFAAGFYVTEQQMMLMNVLAATILVVGAAWLVARSLSAAGARARD